MFGRLALKLKEVFGVNTQFGSERLRTMLLLVMRNASTDSPWPLSNNPYAKYNDPTRTDNNFKFPLWQLVRASTAAPTYFPPEVIVLPSQDKTKEKEFIFVDGGVTMYNNPAFQMFLMATLDRYWPRNPEARWQTGADKMLIVSVGTGTSPYVRAGLEPNEMNLLFNATTIPSALMFAALNEQDLLCRVFGDCRVGDSLDREIGDLMGSAGPLGRQQKLRGSENMRPHLRRRIWTDHRPPAPLIGDGRLIDPADEANDVRRLDRGFAGVPVDIGGEQALLDQMLDQRPRLGGNFRQASDAAARRTL
jgi:uncharacterized protein